LTFKEGILEAKATAGDTHHDFDRWQLVKPDDDHKSSPSKEEIERMVQELEGYNLNVVNDAPVARSTAKNDLELYAYNLKSLMDNELAGKFDPADNRKLGAAVDKTIFRLDSDGLHNASKKEDNQAEGLWE
jgi:hypothetical protein